MATLACLQPDATMRAQLYAALGGVHEVAFFPDWKSLREGLGQEQFDGVVLDPYGAVHSAGTFEVETLRSRYPGLAMVVVVDSRSGGMDLFALGRLGVDAVLPAELGFSHPHQVRETVAEALANALATRVLTTVGPQLGARGIECLRWAIRNGHRAPTVGDLAAAFAATPRAMVRLLREEGSPAPGRLLLWGRLFLAARMRSDGRASIEKVAFYVGYSSGAALARAMRSATGQAPKEVRRRGGLAFVVDAFLQRELGSPGSRGRVRWGRRQRSMASVGYGVWP